MTDKNKELHSALFDLEEELNSLKSAKQQIDEVISIGSNVVKSFEGINSSYSQHLSGLTDDYQSKLKLLKNTIEEIKTNQTSFSEELRELSSSFIKKQSSLNASQLENLGAHSEEIKGFAIDFISKQAEVNEVQHIELVSSTKSLIDDLISSLNNSINSTSEIYQSQNQKINLQLEFYNSFVSKVEQLITTIDSVNFPNRLDKLDNTVSAINIGIQNNQAKLDNLNNNISKELKETVIYINQGFEKLESDIKTKNRNIILMVGVSIFICLCVMVMQFFS